MKLAILIVCSVLLSLHALAWHYHSFTAARLNTIELEWHRRGLAGDLQMPWRYRVFSKLINEGLLRAMPDRPPKMAFLISRFAVGVLLFVLAGLYYRRLGLDDGQILISLAVLGWCAGYGFIGSAFSFDTWWDVCFYLMGALACLGGRFWLCIPLAMLGALNRESSGFIALMPLAFGWRWKVSLAGFAAWGLTMAGLVAWFGPCERMENPQQIWLAIMRQSVSSKITYMGLFAALSVIPLASALRWRQWPRFLRFWGVMILPVWGFVFLCLNNAFEVRYWILPMALIFIPGLFARPIPDEGRAA